MLRIGLITTLLTFTTLVALAQDTLTTSDDFISIRREGLGLVSYGYHWAEWLDGPQLAVLLRQSDNEMARQYAERSQRASRLSTRLMVVWLTLSPVGLYVGARNIDVGGPIALASLIAYGAASFVERGDRTNRHLHQAVELHNLELKASQIAYYDPLRHDREPPPRDVSLADTVSVGGWGWQRRYTYRGMTVMPNVHLKKLLEHFNDKPLRTHQRQSNILQRVGAVGEISAVGLVAQLVLYSVRYYQTSGTARFNRPLALGLSAGIVLGGILRWPANRAQVRMVHRMNELIRSDAAHTPARAGH